MEVFVWRRCKNVVVLILTGVFFVSCSDRSVVSEDQMKRLNAYINSDNAYIAAMFSEENVSEYGVQPALTRTELDILDVLSDRISPEIRQDFDIKYTAWLNCWAPLDSFPKQGNNVRRSLKCNGTEFQDLVEFCRRQDSDIFLLLYQLAARAECPYDQLLLHPVYDLLKDFPEFENYWSDVNLSLENGKPDLASRTCNESTIWYTRKILEKKYGYTYAGRLSAIFDTRKMLLMTHQ